MQVLSLSRKDLFPAIVSGVLCYVMTWVAVRLLLAGREMV